MDNMTRSLILLLAVAGSSAQAAEITWSTSEAKAFATAKTANKLVMIDFYTDWCVWCKRLDKDTYTDANVATESGKVIPLKLDAEKDGIKLAKSLKIDGYPTIVFLDANKKLVYKITGYLPPAQFLGEMEKAQDIYVNFPKYKARIAQNPNDVEALVGLTSAYAAQGDKVNLVPSLAKYEKADPKGENPKAADLYNAVGDFYQNSQEFTKAIPSFEKAIKVAKDPKKEAYARISASYCYFGLKQPKKAIPHLQAVIALGGEYKADAEKLLVEAQK
jgi:thioredoxin-related protein